MRKFRAAWSFGREQRLWERHPRDASEVWSFAIDVFKPGRKKSASYIQFWAYLKGYNYRNLL